MLPILTPHFAIAEDDTLSFEWWQGERKISAWFDAESDDAEIGLELYIGSEKRDGGIIMYDFDSLVAAYRWLVGQGAPGRVSMDSTVPTGDPGSGEGRQ